MDNLTPKQKAFADEYLKCGNATEAARRAGYKSSSARQIGTENLSKPSISEYIAERQRQIDNSRIADVKEVMEYLTSVMRGEVKDQFELDAPIAERTRAAQEILKRDSEKRRYNLELLKIESQLKDNQPDDEAEDNFIDALNASAQEVWNEPVE